MAGSAVQGDQWPPSVESGERDTLVAFLDYVRASVLAKLDGLTAEQAAAPGVPSGTSVLGLVRHLAGAETGWFAWSYAGEDIAYPDLGMALGPGDTPERVAAGYRRAIAHSNAIVAASPDLSARSARRNGQHPDRTLRWILTHMIEETARHAGHADILREQLDGATGR
ncbi:hypothetical protein Athai_49060 [Actinocatenispora thailandica]|uniref:Mini-circle protein n=1 Tax=Actinocatenispora thailandica TaxID=227318 RepID=A0A7R7HZU7_9ACTN|nr:DinB family protein [Actinocatenispora thailandica]BCJ37403.1 hypothetical protein Athai_49060 [Actinocatenispora thailandica]